MNATADTVIQNFDHLAPGRKADASRDDLGRHLITTTARPPIVFTQGQGSWLMDEGGRRYLDLVQGWAVNCLGHSPPALAQALAAQATRLLSASPAFYTRPLLDLTQRLAELSGLPRVFMASTGAEANEGAVKLARRWGSRQKLQPNGSGAYEVIGFDNAFHGRTLAMMSASGKHGWDQIYAPMPSGFIKAKWNNIESVHAAITPRTVAVMLEPVQGEAGVNVADARFMEALRQLTQEQGLLLILDEVQTGMGRCGTAFAFQHYGVMPDIMTLGKGLGGGVPLAALLCSEALNCFEPGDQGSTYTGTALMSAAGLAVLNTVCAPAFLVQVQQRAAQLSEGLSRLVSQHRLVGERGLGLLRALVLPGANAPAIVAAARDLQPEGLLINAARPNVLRFMPALNISEQEVEMVLGLLSRAIGRQGDGRWAGRA